MKDFRISIGSLNERRIGAIVTVMDPAGDEYRVRIIKIEDETALVHPFEKLPLPSESSLSLTLVQALPKKEKMEWIIQKATELGVSTIIPCFSDRSSGLDHTGGSQVKCHRWQHVARKAAEQSRRRKVPPVASCTTLLEAMQVPLSEFALKLVLYEKEAAMQLRDVDWTGIRDGVIVCGPEGGFSDTEIELARNLGYKTVRLGGRILRCETAAVAVLSIIQFVSGNL